LQVAAEVFADRSLHRHRQAGAAQPARRGSAHADACVAQVLRMLDAGGIVSLGGS
jgi:hypothetical protein